MSNRLAAALADYPWDALEPARKRAAEHPDGIVDLSIGTPIDDTPALAAEALAAAGNSPGYPTVAGPIALREAISNYLNRRWQAGVDPAACLPTIGSKEFIAWLPTQLALEPGDHHRRPAKSRPDTEAGLAELAVQSDRPDHSGGRAEGEARLGSRARCRGGLRRVLPGVRLGRAGGLDPRRASVGW
jgi:hypothetical protein